MSFWEAIRGHIMLWLLERALAIAPGFERPHLERHLLTYAEGAEKRAGACIQEMKRRRANQ